MATQDEWYQIDTINQCWEYQPTDDEESYMSGNFYLEGKTVIDYDGCFDLPQTIKDGLVKLGYDLSEL